MDLVAVGLLSVSTFSSGAALYQTRWLWSVVDPSSGGHRHRRGTHRSPMVTRAAPPGARDCSRGVGRACRGARCERGSRAQRGHFAAAATIPPDHRVQMESVSELQAGLRQEARHHRPLIFHVGSLVAPSNVIAVETAGTLITEGVDVKILSRLPSVRNLFGAGHAAREGQAGDVLLFTNVGQGAATCRPRRRARRRDSAAHCDRTSPAATRSPPVAGHGSRRTVCAGATMAASCTPTSAHPMSRRCCATIRSGWPSIPAS